MSMSAPVPAADVPLSSRVYYGWNVLLTTGAALIVGLLTWGMHLPLEKCYYSVVLSFLLVHYMHDHVLFGDRSEAVLVTT